MKATYGFHATMTARPGKGDELVDVLLSATTGMGPATSENCVLFLVGRSASNKDVVHVTEGWTTKEAHAEMFASDEHSTQTSIPANGAAREAQQSVLINGAGFTESRASPQ